MLTSDQQSLWENYLRLENRGSKAERTDALDAFVAAIRSSASRGWIPWAQSLARRIVDGKEDIRVRLPLFEHVLFPALMEGRRDGRADCTRWLSHFSTLLIHRRNCMAQLPPEERTEAGMLRAVLRLDPSNQKARQQLIRTLADGFHYMLHEVPAGVLYSADAATEMECDLLLAEVDEFERLAAEDGAADAHARLLRRCRLHVTAYARYLRAKDRYRGYEHYLDEHHPEWPEYE